MTFRLLAPAGRLKRVASTERQTGEGGFGYSKMKKAFGRARNDPASCGGGVGVVRTSHHRRGNKERHPYQLLQQTHPDHFPWQAPPFLAVAWLTDGLGKMTLQVCLERLDTLEILHERRLAFHFPTSLVEARVTVQFREVFPAPGSYIVSLLADGELIAQKKPLLLHKESSS